MKPAIAKPAAPRLTLASVSKGRREQPLRILLAGISGVGKTTFAASAPAPIFLGCEAGDDNFDVARFPSPSSWQDVLDAVRALAEERHDYKTLVIDTLDSIEPLCWRAVVERDGKAKNIEEVGGGFQKGFTAAVDEWRSLLSQLERLRGAGMAVILLAHVAVKNYKNPLGPDFDRFVMKLDQRAAPVFAEWSDLHLFAQFETWVEGADVKGKRPKGMSTDVRVLHTRRTAAFDAKNRYSLPETLPLSWEDVITAVRQRQVASPAELRAAIEAALEGQAAELTEKVRAAVAAAGEDAVRLAEIDNRLRARLAAKGDAT
jgi:hypothetical protein